MTTPCLQDDVLLTVHLGDAPPADVRHAETCPQCRRRLAALREDLARIDAVLSLPPPAVRHERSLRGLAWVPLALAMAAGLVLVLARPHGQVPEAAAAYDPDVVVFLGDVADALDPLDGYDGEDTLDPLDTLGDADVQGRIDTPATPTDLALGRRSTFGPDESFIRVGCDSGRQRAAVGGKHPNGGPA